ncbi:hypothetical protein [Phenylobacterium sp.]|uniref:hypothetical protein n=1 Tax=Phenylobacterium sp. TaxID=1871053 RepID=UPI0035AFD648
MAKRAALAVLATMMVAACSGPKPASDAGGDKFAGLDTEIRAWRETLIKDRPDCAGAAADKACRSFDVACKAEREITADETAKGVTAKVAAAMTFESWSDGTSEYRPNSAFAEFVHGKSGWSRHEIGPLNLSSCAPV